MTLQTWMMFLPACFALNLAFGPNNLLSLNNGAREGIVRAVTAAQGRNLAFALMIALTAGGLGALLAASELAFTVLKWCGAAYLVWLGVKLLRAGAPEPAAQETVRRPSLAVLARQEFVVAAGNPKAILIFTAFFPQFLDPDRYWSGFTVMGASFLVLETIAIALYAGLGAKLGETLRGSPVLRWFDRLSGGLMIGFGGLLLLARRPTA
jgi:threonine/homoserine/homoserine lactone efflux protein